MACAKCKQARSVMMQDFKDWFATPFRADMSVGGWFLFFGMLIFIAAAWNIILFHMRGA